MSYVPQRGDIIWLDFDPQKGKEIQKIRPALVVSPKIYNQKVGLALCMPITSQIKGYPFEQIIDSTEKIQGAVLCDQLRSMDWRVRNARFLATLPAKQMNEVLDKLRVLLY